MRGSWRRVEAVFDSKGERGRDELREKQEEMAETVIR